MSSKYNIVFILHHHWNNINIHRFLRTHKNIKYDYSIGSNNHTPFFAWTILT